MAGGRQTSVLNYFICLSALRHMRAVRKTGYWYVDTLLSSIMHYRRAVGSVNYLAQPADRQTCGEIDTLNSCKSMKSWTAPSSFVFTETAAAPATVANASLSSLGHMRNGKWGRGYLWAFFKCQLPSPSVASSSLIIASPEIECTLPFRHTPLSAAAPPADERRGRGDRLPKSLPFWRVTRKA